MNIKNTKQMVYETLRDYPKTRNSDIELRKQIGRTYFGLSNAQLAILDTLPDPESIRRSRQKIQETEFKADTRVRSFRKKQEERVKDDLGYMPKGERGVEAHRIEAELDKGFETKVPKQGRMFDKLPPIQT